MAHFPLGSTTVHVLLIAFLVVDFVVLMLLIGATVWRESDRAPQSLRAAREGRAPRRSV
jgi:hypothetical protein